MSHTKMQMSNQRNPEYLAKQSLPPIPKNLFKPTIVMSKEQERNIAIIVTNDDHTKKTNPGYNRQADGRFFYH